MFCPKCGSRKFEKNSGKSFKCETCGFLFFFNTAAAAVGLIFNEKGELLLTIRKHDPAAGKFDLPGGFIEYNETAEDGLKREIKEELNLKIDKMDYFATLPNVYTFAEVTYNTLDIAYVCHPENLDSIRPDDDISDYFFIKPEQINLEDIGLVSAKEFVKLIIKKSDRA